MHELPLVKSIYNSVIRHAELNNAKKVTKVVLEIGVLRDFIPEFIQKYWDYISKKSIAEGSIIEVIDIPAFAQCSKCNTVYPIDMNDITKSKCPKCNYDSGTLVAGKELKIKGIEIEK